MPYRATSGLHLAAQNGDVAALQRLLSEGAPVDLVSEIRYVAEDSDVEYAVWVNHRRLWPFFFRMGLAHPRPPESMPDPRITGTCYAPRRAHPYLGKIEAAGGWKKYERAHLRSLTATFVPKFPRLPAEIVPLIVQFWAHVGDY